MNIISKKYILFGRKERIKVSSMINNSCKKYVKNFKGEGFSPLQQNAR